MSERKNKLLFVLFLSFVLAGCTSNAVLVENAYRAPVTQTTYIAILNGEEKAVSVYEHVETVNGDDVLVPNPYFELNGQKAQMTVYEELIQYENKTYLMPKGSKILNVEGENVEATHPVLFISATGQNYSTKLD